MSYSRTASFLNSSQIATVPRKAALRLFRRVARRKAGTPRRRIIRTLLCLRVAIAEQNWQTGIFGKARIAERKFAKKEDGFVGRFNSPGMRTIDAKANPLLLEAFAGFANRCSPFLAANLTAYHRSLLLEEWVCQNESHRSADQVQFFRSKFFAADPCPANWNQSQTRI